MADLMVMENTAVSIIDTLDNQTITHTMQKISTFQSIVQKTLKKDHDFGEIPGTNKPTLLKPGGEKICMMMGIVPEYEFLTKDVDFNKGLINYEMRCKLMKGNYKVSEGVGSCNSLEPKYRYIWLDEDKLPTHFSMDNLESKERYGRTQYKVDNPDIAGLANTILKMAKKRSFIDAVLQVASLSEIFTQDLEDMREFIEREGTETMDAKAAANIKITFGKHKGKTLGELYKTEIDYIKWLAENSKSDYIKKGIEILKSAAKASRDKKTANKGQLSQLEKSNLQGTKEPAMDDYNEPSAGDEPENFYTLDDDEELPFG